MKTLHLSIIAGVVIAIAGISVIVYEIFSTSIEIVGLQDSYKIGDQVKFSFVAKAYTIPCSYPEATLYKTNQPTVQLFELKFPPFMCPIGSPSLVTLYFPTNDTYSVTVTQSGSYTLDVSYLDKETKKEFEVK
ncbi:MAG: hypothetical protein KGI05_09390 [Thaumarchaeota archaeon]|nr:hypothetical protein [Nitrososphaerota archaeon]